jgi:beta-lactamase superfamily II metal-dependent hydrolase
MNNLIITLFDVEQGNSTLVQTPNGRHILLDCGTNATTGFTPSKHLKNVVGVTAGIKNLDQVILTHADEDHIADIEGISGLNPTIVARNRSVSPDYIRSEKMRTGGSVEPTVERYIDLDTRYSQPIAVQDWGGVTIDHFWNVPSQDITELNDLSLVTFITYGDFKIIFPGDLSAKGWQELLYRNGRSAEFIKHLQGTTVFVASHHGREDGYCEEIFSFAKPMLIIFSDKSVEHDTQDTMGLYKKHVNGSAKFMDRSGQTADRYILTTRDDGAITFKIDGSQFWVTGK